MNVAIGAQTDRGAVCREHLLKGESVYSTKNDVTKAAREAIVSLGNGRSADAIDLHTQCKHAHWNTKDASFIARRELFDSVNEQVDDFVDLIAERAAQLGSAVEGAARTAAGYIRRRGAAVMMWVRSVGRS
jgi:hypothetical protein